MVVRCLVYFACRLAQDGQNARRWAASVEWARPRWMQEVDSGQWAVNSAPIRADESGVASISQGKAGLVAVTSYQGSEMACIVADSLLRQERGKPHEWLRRDAAVAFVLARWARSRGMIISRGGHDLDGTARPGHCRFARITLPAKLLDTVLVGTI
ncbi:hypothetical protein MN608_06106 [Microdochium nivale]|nr:hypothetical protein MN608_06106 [Microdochium nivale]